MQLLKYLPLAFAASAIATPLIARDGAKVVSDINAVDAAVKKLNASITAFTANNYLQALAVQSNSDAVLKALNKTTTDTKASAPFSEDEAFDIATVVVSPLTDDVISTLTNLESKKKAFNASPFIPLGLLVLKSLKDQKQATLDLTAAIKDKAPADLKDAVQPFVQPILDKFDEAIKVYSPSFGFGKE